MTRPRTALIDADIACYRAAVACETSIQWDDDAPATVYADAKRAAKVAIDTIRAWAEIADCKAIIACLTGRSNFRRAVLPTYKHTRAGKSKPLVYVLTVQAVTEAFDTKLVDGLEGDDLLAILATRPGFEEAVVLTMDKDLRGVPGWHLNPVKDRSPVQVTPDQADRFWMSQVLTGDTSDGYVGLPGCGPKGADKVLGTSPSPAAYLWPKVVSAYRAKGLTEADALVQARASRILRNSDYDKSTRSVRLWHPTEPEWKTIDSLVASSETTGKRTSARSGKTTEAGTSATEA